MLTHDEKQGIARTQAGDPASFEPIVAKYQPRLYRYIHGRVRDTEVAKDLTQEVWLKVLRGIKHFRGDSAFSSWLYRIGENICIDYFRKQKHDTEPLHLIDEYCFTETHVCPSQTVERAELRRVLQNAIKCLSDARREVFVLYYHHELPIKAIAKKIGRSEGTIKSHLRNARLQLQELLTPYLNTSDLPTEM